MTELKYRLGVGRQKAGTAPCSLRMKTCCTSSLSKGSLWDCPCKSRLGLVTRHTLASSFNQLLVVVKNKNHEQFFKENAAKATLELFVEWKYGFAYKTIRWIWLVLKAFVFMAYLYKFKIFDNISHNKKLLIFTILNQGFT